MALSTGEKAKQAIKYLRGFMDETSPDDNFLTQTYFKNKIMFDKPDVTVRKINTPVREQNYSIRTDSDGVRILNQRRWEETITPGYLFFVESFDKYRIDFQDEFWLSEYDAHTTTEAERNIMLMGEYIMRQFELQKEIQASQILTDGTVTFKYDGVPDQVVDFGRTSSLKNVSDPAITWDNTSTAKVYKDIENYIDLFSCINRRMPTHILAGYEVKQALFENTEFKTILDNRRMEEGHLATKYRNRYLTFSGTFQDIPIYTYNGMFNRLMLECNYFLDRKRIYFINEEILGGEQMFGTIEHMEAPRRSEYYLYDGFDQYKGNYWLGFQSSMILAPKDPDGSMSVKVVA